MASLPRPSRQADQRAGRLPTIAVILGGGVGSRVGLHVPKQLLTVAGKPILEHTLGVFAAHPEVDEILVVMAPGFVAEAEHVVASVGQRVPTRVIEGGSCRNDSTLLALAALGDVEANVLMHDAVRPLVDPSILTDCLRALASSLAVDVTIPSADTIVEVEDGRVVAVPDRSRLHRGQTPQGFRLSTLREAYSLATLDPDFSATDDCGVVLRYLPDVEIRVVAGSEQNLKVTEPVDVFLTDKLFQLRSQTVVRKPLDDYAASAYGRVAVVFGGSYGIGGDLCALLRSLGTQVFPFSRSTTGTDVADAGAVRAALDDVVARTGRIDLVVNAAGVLHRGTLAEMDDETVEDSIAVNLLGPLHIARAAHRHLARTNGSLLFYTSSSYTRGRAGYSTYSASKAAVVNLTQALADEWSGDGIRVNCINPERTATPMRVKAFGDEPAGTLLSSRAVALTSLDVLMSPTTGQIVDVRRDGVSQTSDRTARPRTAAGLAAS